MTIVYKPLYELKEYENNPRFNDEAVQYVENSIVRFGFRVPIVIDKENVIIAGHTRFRAAREIGMDAVPCIIADDLTEQQVIAFRLVDNKTAELAGWDFVALDKELAELGIDMEMFGFIENDEYDIDDLFADKPNVKEKPPKRCRCPHCGSVVEV